MATAQRVQPALVPIGEAARRFGVAASALRFYEERGLITPTTRDGGRRWYGWTELRRIAFIRQAQQMGMNLDDIATLIHSDGAGWRELVRTYIDQLRQQQERIVATLAELQSALECPSDHPLLECHHMLDALDDLIAGKPAGSLAPEQDRDPSGVEG